MCPVCLATAAVIAGSATGTSGMGALIARTVLKRKRVKPIPQQTDETEVQDGIDYDTSEAPESGLAR
jgi:hypothetical protein